MRYFTFFFVLSSKCSMYFTFTANCAVILTNCISNSHCQKWLAATISNSSRELMVNDKDFGIRWTWICMLIHHWLTEPFCTSVSVQFSSVTQLCPTLCNPMNHSTPGLPVHHQLPESTQTPVHWISDATQPSHPLLSPSPPALNLSQHQGLFQ